MTAATVDTRSGRAARRTQRAAAGLSRLQWFNLAAAAGLLALGVLSFGPIFSGAPGFRAAGGGALVGLLVAVVAAWRRWTVFLTVAASIIGYFAFGGVFALPGTTLAGVIPTVDTVRRLALLTVDAWRDLLTVSTPASSFTGPAVVPFISGLVCAVIAGTVALRAKQPVLAAIPALALLVMGILWGTKSAPLATVQGVVFAAITLIWAALRRLLVERQNSLAVFEGQPSGSASAVRRIAAGLAVLGVAGLVATASAPAVLGDTNRYTLRDDVVPPLDLHQYASPLTGYRYLERNQKQVPLLSVSGLQPGQRLTLAVLDSYNGNVFDVDGVSANYLRIGSEFDDGTADSATASSTLSIAIKGYDGVWMPGGGAVRGVEFQGDSQAARKEGLYYNPASGTLLTTAGVSSGAQYDVTQVVRAPTADATLAHATVAAGGVPADTNVPEAISKLASDWTSSAKNTMAQLRAIESHLRQNGFYSNGSDGKSRAGHTTERLSAMLEGSQLIGDDEQYAAVMALMAHSLGVPARVVMGIYPDPKKTTAGSAVTLTGNDAHVWVEVPFANGQWARFDPTPDRTRTPNTETTKPKEQPLPQVLPPPVPPKDKPAVPDTLADGKQKDQVKPPTAGTDWGRIIRLVATVVGVGALLAAPFMAIVGMKARRRKRRRRNGSSADQVSGAWAELADRATDLGFKAPVRATRQEVARRLDEHFVVTSASPFASSVDATVFGFESPSSAEAGSLWDSGDRLVKQLSDGAGRWRRVRAAVSIRSLVHPPRWAFTNRGMRLPGMPQVGREAS